MIKKDYNIGLDIGATSVGFAGIDEQYDPIKLKGKTVVGVNLFEEGQTAADRRSFRTTRRRLNRRKWRLSLLEEFFDPYITPVDPAFFARLKESNLSPKDNNKNFSRSLLFPDITDQKFYEEYPTIYHLRYALMTENKKFDLRAIFLAIHHMIKYRGNFLNSTPVAHFDTSKIDFANDFSKLNRLYLNEDPNNIFEINLQNVKEISDILLDHSIKKFDKQKQVAKLLLTSQNDKELDKRNKQIATQISKAILGYNFSLNEILKLEAVNKSKWKLNFSSADIDDTLPDLISELDESQESILNIILSLYSRLTLNGIVPSGMSLSESMIDKYGTHKEHLDLLKKYLKTLPIKNRKEIAEAYAEYVGNSLKKSGHISQEEFYKAVKKNLDKSETAQKILSLISEEKFMPKQRTNQNGVIPYQLHQKELDQIIVNQSQYYPWLAELNPVTEHKDAKYKLDELIAFRVPYYVGPLIDPKTIPQTEQGNKNASFAWMVRKENGQITPWNFDKKVDRISSANNFIKRMTTKDTYLIGEDVLPAHSLIYERFKVLNELNMIRVNGKKLSVSVKQNLYNDLFKQQKTINRKKLANYLQANLGIPERPQITGLSDPEKFNSQLSSYIDLQKILGSEIVDDPNKQDDLEKIIEWSTVFEDSRIYKVKLQEIGWFTEKQKNELVSHRYQGWGRLSKKLLVELKDKNGRSIIDLLWNSQRTFMEIQSRPEFAEQITNENQDKLTEDNYEDVLADAYTSPQNKKAIRQVIKVVDDIVKATGKAPKFISLEFARSDERSDRVKSRKTHIQKIYETTAKELLKDDQLIKELGSVSDLSDRLYLYFTQLGRDMYTGKPINIDEISTMYDIDHILPQAFLKDDSLDNRVLVRRQDNNAKSDTVPALKFGKMKPFWNKLQKHGLISKRKLNNLQTNPESIDKFKAVGFVNRQLVETRQVIKLAANILASRYPDSKIIEVKASLTHQMRESFNLIKNRDVNDYHHAVDAYLSAFVGQYLYNRYPKLQPYFVYGQFKKFDKQSTRIGMKTNHFNFLYDLEPEGKNVKIKKPTKIINKETGEIIGDRDELVAKLNRVYNFKYMLVSQEVYTRSGALFDQTIYPANSGKKLIPLKQNKTTAIYGGYSGSKAAYMSIIRLRDKKGGTYRIVGIPVRAVNKLNQAKKKSNEKYLAELKAVIEPQIAKTKKDRKTGQRVLVPQEFDVIIPEVMYRQLIVDGDQKFTLGGTIDRYNAVQLVLNQEILTFLEQPTKYKDADTKLLDIYDQIVNLVEKYFMLFDSKRLAAGRVAFEKLPTLQPVDKMPSKLIIIRRIIQGLHDNAARTDLKAINGSSSFGRLQKRNGIILSPNACLIYQSPTGLFERKVYLNTISPLK
ncbi:type II CRISPR RNA-guided endonuclease Cas9 [Limosilactobacillus reuteri]|uniref:type II CRISPR RNA-guided endonuclease Cas9 n=1 Tax=Limosilactobacillus reuteri TaxID=1598 RepID=UPI0002EC926F|nr:type II CRISPR RNA-guided endonuclease Cas9 [Limosilactobacillus reuteri]